MIVLVALAVVALWAVLMARRSVQLRDDAYVEGWRDGYDLGYAHGANGRPRQRERYEPFVRRQR